MVLKQLFFSKNYEKLPNDWGLLPETPIASGGWGIRPQTPVCDTFQLLYTSLLKHVSQFRDFRVLTIGLSPLFDLVSSCVPTPGQGFQSSIKRYLCPHKKSFFEVSDDVITCDLSPPNKNPGYAYGGPRC